MLAALLTFLVSPVFAKHGCGLSSWPLEMSIGSICAIVAFLTVSTIVKKWRAWAMVGIFVVSSCLVTGTYLEFLHSAAFPEALLDESGKAWVNMLKHLHDDDKTSPHQPSLQTPTGGPPAAPRQQNGNGPPGRR
jgi:hypothetical protein